MAVLPTGIGPVTGGYEIGRSLRFNSADSAYLNRTFGSGGNTQTWTWSAWIKRSSFANNPQRLFYTGNSNNNETNIYLSVDRLAFEYYVDPTNYYVVSSAVFRDPSAWYHFVVVSDTTNATSSDRMRIYVNGARITNLAISSYPAQNANLTINSAAAHYIGRRSDGTQSFDGYMTEINFINGQALTPSSFGETDSNTGVWKPKKYDGTYGTNGFYLSFKDNTSTTTLGYDDAGSNDWTTNNFSVTAGAGNDSLVDSPTSYGTDTGVGGEVRGNYATWNPLDKDDGITSVTNGNLNVVTNGSNGSIKSTIAFPTGKWYWEVTSDTINSGGTHAIGIIPQTQPPTNNMSDSGKLGYALDVSFSDRKFENGTATSYGTYTQANGAIYMLAFDQTSGKLWYGINGTWLASGDPAAGTNASSSSISTSTVYCAAVSDNTLSGTFTVNFGQRAFAYTAPSGFKALCTQNLPTPTIGATSTTQANDYFNAVLYTGTGSSLGVTGVGFQPDWVWIKERNAAADHGLYDAVRGVQKQLESNTTTAETTETTGLTAFGTDGFTVGALAQLNTNGDTYVAWNWKANGAGSSNTAGTITSTVSANTTSGFSIVTYTGNSSAGATVGHGLGVAPDMVIAKQRSSSGQDWIIYNRNLPSASYTLSLNSTAGQDSTNFTTWNGTAPSSTLITLGSSDRANASGVTYVAYCFAPVAGYSAFGSYTGTGNTDGPFVYTGFRPRFVLTKQSSSTSNWSIHDTSRAPYNLTINNLYPDVSDAEYTGTSESFDFLSNGFKPRSAGTSTNASGGTFIYMAFAESPFKYSLAR
jgi:hypothetical protein